MLPPLVDGPPEGELALVGFGSTKGVVSEAREILAQGGVDAAAVHLRQVWHFPSAQLDGILSRYRTVLTRANNRTGQLARLIRAETGRNVGGTVSRCDGLPFTPDDLVRRIKERKP
jgi:2-oxoglutarate ferredoxin oxidoreductase subunit alpha